MTAPRQRDRFASVAVCRRKPSVRSDLRTMSDAGHYCPVSRRAREESQWIARPERVCRAWRGAGCSVGTNQDGGASHAPAPCVRHDNVSSPGQPGGPADSPGPARAKTCRPDDADSHDAGNLACAASACMAFDTGGRACAAAWRSSSDAVAAAGAPKPWRTMPGTTPGFSHHCSPHGGAPARNPSRLPPNATMARDSSGHSGCPGPMPWRRHIQRIERPNGPRTDAASACAEPAGRSGRSCHHDDASRPERSRRTAFKGSRRKNISSASQWTSHSGDRADASGPARCASGAWALAGEAVGAIISGRSLRQDRRSCQVLFPGYSLVRGPWSPGVANAPRLRPMPARATVRLVAWRTVPLPTAQPMLPEAAMQGSTTKSMTGGTRGKSSAACT